MPSETITSRMKIQKTATTNKTYLSAHPAMRCDYDTVIAMYACADRSGCRMRKLRIGIGGLIMVAAQLCYGQLDGVSLK